MLPPIYTLLSGNSAVAALVSTRIYPHGEAPQEVAIPYVTWFLVAGMPENRLDSLPDIDRCTVQVDCWHPTSAGVVTLATAVRNALEPVCHVTEILLNQRELETRLYRLALQLDYFLPR